MGQTIQHHHPQHHILNQPPAAARSIFGMHMQNMTIPKEEPQLPPEQPPDLSNWTHTQHQHSVGGHHMSPPHQSVNISPQIQQVLLLFISNNTNCNTLMSNFSQ